MAFNKIGNEEITSETISGTLKNSPENQIEQETNFDFNAMLNKIDFAELRKVFVDNIKNLGVEKSQENLNFIDKSGFDEKGVIFSMASYDVVQNTIGINKEETRKFLNLFFKENAFWEFLHTVIHEECHAVSLREVELSIEEHPVLIEWHEYPRVKSGYHERIRQESKVKSLFEFFNEAVVEKWSNEIMKEYAEKIGLDANEINKFLESRKGIAVYWKENIALTELFVDVIAKAKQKHPEDVWKSFFVGIINGKDLFDDNLTAWTNKVLGKNFIESFASINIRTHPEKIRETLEEASVFLDKIRTTETSRQKTVRK